MAFWARTEYGRGPKPKFFVRFAIFRSYIDMARGKHASFNGYARHQCLSLGYYANEKRIELTSRKIDEFFTNFAILRFGVKREREFKRHVSAQDAIMPRVQQQRKKNKTKTKRKSYVVRAKYAHV